MLILQKKNRSHQHIFSSGYTINRKFTNLQEYMMLHRMLLESVIR